MVQLLSWCRLPPNTIRGMLVTHRKIHGNLRWIIFLDIVLAPFVHLARLFWHNYHDLAHFEYVKMQVILLQIENLPLLTSKLFIIQSLCPTLATYDRCYCLSLGTAWDNFKNNKIGIQKQCRNKKNYRKYLDISLTLSLSLSACDKNICQHK